MITLRRLLTRERSRGQAMTEFALVAPIFFVLLFSIIEFGRAVYYIQMLNNAAREGARYAIVHGGASLTPSGPMPVQIPPVTNTYDLQGDYVVSTVKNHAIAIIDSTPADFLVNVRWCATTACPDTNEVGKGDGTNARNQTVKVDVRYTFRPMIAGLVPLPTFTLTGGSILVVNH